MDIRQENNVFLGREGSPRPLIVGKTDGSFVFDEKGNKYIDFFMGWCVGNIGWNVKEVIQKIKKFDFPTYVSPSYYYKEWGELAKLLAKITPLKSPKCFRATGGTEAIEIALQAAMSHTKRHKFISIEGGYHGHSIGAMSIGSSDFRKWYKNLLHYCYKVKSPLDVKAARKVEELLTNGDIAAYISEPIICNLSVEIPEKEFFYRVQKACKKYGTLFIMDEVATGFGRTGKLFASEHYDLRPDIMTLGKGLSGGYGAIGATIMTGDVAKSFEFDFSFYSTFGWHPLSVRAATANLKYLLKNENKLLANVQKASQYIEKRLKNMNFKEKPQIRIKGLAIGVVFSNSDYPHNIISRSLKKGLLLANATGSDIVLFPALDINKETLKQGLDILEQCL